jgi:hypothetical protein
MVYMLVDFNIRNEKVRPIKRKELNINSIQFGLSNIVFFIIFTYEVFIINFYVGQHFRTAHLNIYSLGCKRGITVYVY